MFLVSSSCFNLWFRVVVLLPIPINTTARLSIPRLSARLPLLSLEQQISTFNITHRMVHSNVTLLSLPSMISAPTVSLRTQQLLPRIPANLPALLVSVPVATTTVTMVHGACRHIQLQGCSYLSYPLQGCPRTDSYRPFAVSSLLRMTIPILAISI